MWQYLSNSDKNCIAKTLCRELWPTTKLISSNGSGKYIYSIVHNYSLPSSFISTPSLPKKTFSFGVTPQLFETLDPKLTTIFSIGDSQFYLLVSHTIDNYGGPIMGLYWTSSLLDRVLGNRPC